MAQEEPRAQRAAQALPRPTRQTGGRRRANARRAGGAAQAAEALRNTIYQVEHYSSLIARTDPFIVLPGFMARQNGHPYQPRAGDYAVVIAGDKLYPAIFGDIGPSYKIGEASLRLAQAVDPRATAQRSPVDDLKITYLVFPGSADGPPGPPDLGKMRQRCQSLLNEIGGNTRAVARVGKSDPPAADAHAFADLHSRGYTHANASRRHRDHPSRPNQKSRGGSPRERGVPPAIRAEGAASSQPGQRPGTR